MSEKLTPQEQAINNYLKAYQLNFQAAHVQTVIDAEQDLEQEIDHTLREQKMFFVNLMLDQLSAGMAIATPEDAAETAEDVVPSPKQRQSMKVDIPSQKMKDALAILPAKEQKKFKVNGGKNFSLDLNGAPKELLEKLMADPTGLAISQLQAMARALGNSLNISEDYEVDSITKLHTALMAAPVIDGCNIEVKALGRWYPTTVQTNLKHHWSGKYVAMQGNLIFCQDLYQGIWASYFAEDFVDENGARITRKLGELLEENNLRLVRKETTAEMRKLTPQAAKMANQSGAQMLLGGPGFVQGFFGPRESHLASPTSKARVVVEATLGLQDGRSGQNLPNLPFVRVFHLQSKLYTAVDVRDLEAYGWDEHAVEKLTLPVELEEVVKTVFTSGSQGLFGDVLSNRHGGMIILACGGPGVGKTLTAEVFAEHTKRPLYVMEIGELGTNVNQLEERLQQIFERVEKWNAVLLFDEADIYLHKRGEDLDHNAVVGVFLRLMDYYKGLLFMTTNRGDIIDPAFQSRISLRLDYPTLDPAARTRIWKTMFKAAGLTLLDDRGTEARDDLYQDLAGEHLNGRQIRNVARLVKVIYPAGKVTVGEVRKLMKFSPRGQ